MTLLPPNPPKKMGVNELIAKLLEYPPTAMVEIREGYHNATLSINNEDIMYDEDEWPHEGED